MFPRKGVLRSAEVMCSFGNFAIFVARHICVSTCINDSYCSTFMDLTLKRIWNIAIVVV